MPIFPHVRKAEYSLLEAALPGRPAAPFGVLLLEPEGGELFSMLREDADGLAEVEDAEVLNLLSEDFRCRIAEMGGRSFLHHLEDTLSNALRITERRAVAVRSFPIALERLYQEHVEGLARGPAEIVPFGAHLPLYSLCAAAGRFGQDMEVEPEGWVAAPAGLRLSRDMFAVHVAGRSMEPLIPDGAIAVFRYGPAGSRQGRRVLVWRPGSSGSGGEFTIKIYESEKRRNEHGWEHRAIRLKPLNPEFDVLDLDRDAEYKVLGEYVCTLAVEDTGAP